MTANITTIETGNKFGVSISIDGGELERRGPFPDADTAGATADRIAAIWHALRANVHRVTAAATRGR